MHDGGRHNTSDDKINNYQESLKDAIQVIINKLDGQIKNYYEESSSEVNLLQINNNQHRKNEELNQMLLSESDYSQSEILIEHNPPTQATF